MIGRAQVCHEAALGKLRVENAVTEEQKSSISLANVKLCADMKAQEDAFAKRVKELQITVDGLESVVKERGMRIAAADRELTNGKKNEEQLKAKVLELQGDIEQANKEKEDQLSKLRTNETARVIALENQIALAKEEVEDLIRKKEECVTNANTLMERYMTGDLVSYHAIVLIFRNIEFGVVRRGEGFYFCIACECA